MIGSRAKSAIVMRADANALTRRALVRFDSTPIVKGENQTKKEEYFFTTGLYTLKFKPNEKNMRCKGRPFVINGDMFNNNAHHYRFGSYEELEQAAKTDKRVRWMLENTTFKKRMLNVAIDHIDLPIPFTFDVVKYCRRLKKCGKISRRFLQEEVE